MRPDDPYGHAKRLNFVLDGLGHLGSGPVLDIGCGTGIQLTLPLARALPNFTFTGIDSDQASIGEANSGDLPTNLRFGLPDSLDDAQRFVAVIASEVLEHVEDPSGFLGWLKARLAPGGRLILTVPNGFGPFECSTLAQLVISALGMDRLVRRLRGRVSAGSVAGADTLAVSPHVNFFGWGELQILIDQAGLRVVHSRNRTLLCGFLLDQLVIRLGLVGWNARIADRLPPWMVSDWMLELEVAGPSRPGSWRRGGWAAWRRRLNLRWTGVLS